MVPFLGRIDSSPNGKIRVKTGATNDVIKLVKRTPRENTAPAGHSDAFTISKPTGTSAPAGKSQPISADRYIFKLAAIDRRNNNPLTSPLHLKWKLVR